jgi:hypothetical protein
VVAPAIILRQLESGRWRRGGQFDSGAASTVTVTRHHARMRHAAGPWYGLRVRPKRAYWALLLSITTTNPRRRHWHQGGAGHKARGRLRAWPGPGMQLRRYAGPPAGTSRSRPRVAQKTRTQLQAPHLDPRAPDSESRPRSRLAGVGSLLPVNVRASGSGPGPGPHRRVRAPAQRLAAPAPCCAPGRSCCWSLAVSGRRMVLGNQESRVSATRAQPYRPPVRALAVGQIRAAALHRSLLKRTRVSQHARTHTHSHTNAHYVHARGTLTRRAPSVRR